MEVSKSKIDVNDVMILFADLQTGIADLPLTVSPDRLRAGVTALAKLAILLDLPTFVTAVSPDGNPPKLLPELVAGLTSPRIYLRTRADSFENDELRQDMEASGRRTLLISGVATEIAVQLPAISGVDLGFRTFVVVDAVGGMSSRTEAAVFSRIEQAGGTLISIPTLTLELGGDFSSEIGQQAMGILFSLASPIEG